ncbi:MAG: histidine kinase [Paludibacter sp.]|nr:histidine kinase [Paludibacter sp.]
MRDHKIKILTNKKKFANMAAISSFLYAIAAIIPIQFAIEFFSFKILVSIFLLIFINLLILWIVNLYLYLSLSYRGRFYDYIVRPLVSYIVVIIISGIFIKLLLDTIFFSELLILKEYAPNYPSRIFAPFFTAAFSNTIVLLLLQNHIIDQKRVTVEIENSRLKATNAEAKNLQLRQYIHPHFLFNSLSILKSLIDSEPERAQEYLLSMSGFLRKSISLTQESTSLWTLQNELELNTDYIAMQKLRFGKAMEIEINLPSDVPEKYMVPAYSIQLLLENALKHNYFTPEQPIHIKVFQEGDYLCVSNNITKHNNDPATPRTGLKNLSERSTIAVSKDIIIDNNGKEFKVSIYLKPQNSKRAR